MNASGDGPRAGAGAAARAEYAARVNRVIDYVERNLDRPLALTELAGVAHFSPFHFHRIFGALVGETLGAFVGRLRVERAARMLVTSPGVSVTAVALECGFASPSSFARAFKEAFGVSASEWRAGAHRKIRQGGRKIGETLRKRGEAATGAGWYFEPGREDPTWRCEMSTEKTSLRAVIEVKEMPELNVVYLRHTGPYGQAGVVPPLVKKLRQWAVPRGIGGPEARLVLVAHDSPTITEVDKLRLSVCLSAPEGTRGEGEVGTMRIPGGRFAVARFEVSPAEIGAAWEVVVGEWLPQSGYQPDDRLCYEEVLTSPPEHPEGKYVLAICVPVRPL